MKQNNIDYEAEYYKIKKNNRCLAKALAAQQQLTKRFQDENSFLQKKLYNSSTLNMQYDKTINELLKFAKKNLDKCVDLANNFSDTLLLCHEGANLKKTLDGDNDVNDLYKVNLRSNSPGSHKTQAVKPMVSGHVIHHPTINLSRLTEPRISAALPVENSVQNHISSSSPPLNNHEPMLHSNSHTRLAIQGYLGESDISEDESDDSFEDDLTNSGTNLTPPRSARSLGPLLELSEEESETPNNSITKEVRIMLEPLHLENVTRRYKTVKFHEDLPENPPIRKRPVDDPLEGTSTMLDDSGNLADSNNYVSKPRQASKRICVGCDSDSDDSTVHCDRKTKSKFVTKRKSLTKKKDITGQKYKIKRNKTNDDKENNSTNDSLDRSNESEHFNISIEDGDNPFERRSRRLTPKCLAEPSLKMKMRR